MTEPAGGDAPLFDVPIVRRRVDRSDVPAPEPATPRRMVAMPGGTAPPAGVRMPPPTVPAAAPAPGHPERPERAIALVGIVDGAVSVETRPPDFWGWRAAAAATVLAGVAGVLATGLPAGTRALLIASAVVALAGAAAALAHRWRGRHQPPAVGPDPRALAVRRFRVRSHTGEVVACALYGDLVGGEVRHGDMVRVTGRRTRDGEVTARRVAVLTPPAGPVVSEVTARRPMGRRVAGWSSGLGFLVAAAVLALTAAAVIG